MLKATAQETKKFDNGRGYDVTVTAEGTMKQLVGEAVATINGISEGIAKDTPFPKEFIMAKILEHLADTL